MTIVVSALIAAIIVFNILQTDIREWEQKPATLILGKTSAAVKQNYFGQYFIYGHSNYRATIIGDETVTFEKFWPKGESSFYMWLWIALGAVIYCPVTVLFTIIKSIKKTKKVARY